MDRPTAERFALDWIESWNSHDLDRILAHYSDGLEFSSPFIVTLAGEASGKLKGKTAVGAYWARALALRPNLHFQLRTLLVGVTSLVIHYARHDGRVAAEFFEFDDNGKVVRSGAHYDG